MKNRNKIGKEKALFVITFLVIAIVLPGSKQVPVAPANNVPAFFNVYCELGVFDKKDNEDEKKKREATKKKLEKKKGKIIVISAQKGEVGIAVQECLEMGGKVDHVEPVFKKRKKKPPTKKVK